MIKYKELNRNRLLLKKLMQFYRNTHMLSISQNPSNTQIFTKKESKEINKANSERKESTANLKATDKIVSNSNQSKKPSNADKSEKTEKKELSSASSNKSSSNNSNTNKTISSNPSGKRSSLKTGNNNKNVNNAKNTVNSFVNSNDKRKTVMLKTPIKMEKKSFNKSNASNTWKKTEKSVKKKENNNLDQSIVNDNNMTMIAKESKISQNSEISLSSSRVKARNLRRMITKRAQENKEILKKYFHKFLTNGIIVQMRKNCRKVNLHKKNKSNSVLNFGIKNKGLEPINKLNRSGVITRKKSRNDEDLLMAKRVKLLEKLIYKINRQNMLVTKSVFDQWNLRAKIFSLDTNKKKKKKKKNKKSEGNDDEFDELAAKDVVKTNKDPTLSSRRKESLLAMATRNMNKVKLGFNIVSDTVIKNIKNKVFYSVFYTLEERKLDKITESLDMDVSSYSSEDEKKNNSKNK